jgi:hypothetical protein
VRIEFRYGLGFSTTGVFVFMLEPRSSLSDI